MFNKFLTLLFIMPAFFLHGVTVNDEARLNGAINAANVGGPDIKFGSDIKYTRSLQPLNADNVLNSLHSTFTIDGRGHTLMADSENLRGFFARTSTGTVTIKDLTISKAHAKGGDGGNRGGGGAGLGGGIFVNSNSTVILDNVSFQDCKATGGTSSGSFGGQVLGANGGGGFGGDGGAAGTGAGGGGGFNSRGGMANGLGGSGGGGFNGKGGSCNSYGAGGGGGGGFDGGASTNSKNGGGGAGDLGDGTPVMSNGVGGAGGQGSLPAGTGGIGATDGTFSGGGGSGGVRGNPGVAASNAQGGSSPANGGGGGGGGYSSDPAYSTDGGSAGTGFGGGGSGAANTAGLTGEGGAGGFGGGGGGSGHNSGTGGTGNGGKGGDFAGGGGAGNASSNTAVAGLTGGEGGFAGGGGGGGTNRNGFSSTTVTGTGGAGGFGAGGGGGATPGAGGFGAGDGGAIQGGGGGAMGADIFIQDGSNVVILTGVSFSGSKLAAGSGANSGKVHGRNIFMMSGGQITVENLTKDSSVPYAIESEQGNAAGGGLTLGSGNTATFSINGANTYTGETNIYSGTLMLNGSVETPVIVYGGTFCGKGAILPTVVPRPFSRSSSSGSGGDLIVSGGVVAPMGGKFATLIVGGDLVFNGGTFQTTFDSLGNANLLYVCDTATLAPAATVTAQEAKGNFIKGQTITLLKADGGVAGTFGTANLPLGADGLPLFKIQYTSNAVEALVLRDHLFVHPYIKPGNPRHVAKYMSNQPSIDPNSDFGFIIRALGVLSDKELNKVLNMMHQGVFGTLEWMNLSTSAQVMQMFNQPHFRLPTEEGAETASSFEPELTAAADESRPFYPRTPVRRGCQRDLNAPHHVYFQPFGTWNTQSQKGELRGFQYESAGFLTGYDYLFRNFYVGAGLGYAYTNFRWSQSAGKGHIHQVYGGVHGSYFNRYVSATVGTMLGGNFYDTERHIIASAPGHANGAIDRTAHSNNSGFQWNNHLGLVGDFSSFFIPLQLFANLDHFYLHNGSFNETGAGSINLRVSSKVSNALRSELGLSSSYTFQFSGGSWTPYARISWVNKTLLSSSTYRGGFRGQLGTFSASATNKGTNQWAPGLGIEFANTHGFSLLVNSRAEINGKQKDYSADMRLGYTF